MMKAGIFSVIIIWALSATAFADQSRILKDSKGELDKIKKQLNDARQKADSLNRLEADLQKTISGYGESVSRNRKLINKTERQLASVRKELEQNDQRLETAENRLRAKRGHYVNLLVDYYRRKKSSAELDGWDFASFMSERRMVRYLASISGGTAREINRVDDSLRLLAQHADSLNRTGSHLSRLRKEKQAKVNLDLTLKQKQEASLGDVRRQSDLLKERVETLSEAALRMEEIIADLELAQQRRRQEGETPRYRAGSFSQLKGSLQPPIKGKIISSFGWKKNKVTKLSSFSPGIDIKPSTGQTEVMACAPGRVVYVGQLRGYNNFVIIEHDDNFYTTYAGLGIVAVELDELLSTRDKIGSLAEGKFHFEIRRGREHLDPVIWLDINEF